MIYKIKFASANLLLHYFPKHPLLTTGISSSTLNYFVPQLDGYMPCPRDSRYSYYVPNVHVFKYIVPSSIFPGSNDIFPADKAIPSIKEPDFVITPLDSQHCFVSILLPDCFTSAYSIRDMLLCRK